MKTKLDKIYMTQHCAALKLKAAQKYNISPEKCHIGHLLIQGMLERPDALNQIDAANDERETNLSVVNRSMCVANAMDNKGLHPGDSIILMGPNHLDMCIPFYACHYNGYQVCAVDPGMTAGDLTALFTYVFPKMVFCQKPCVEKIKEALLANNIQGDIVIFDDKDENLEAFTRRHKGTEINFRPKEFDQDKIMAWLPLTSGTTGLPKVAMIPFATLTNSLCCWWDLYVEKFELTLAMATLQWLSTYVFYASGPLRCYTRLQSSGTLTAPTLVGIINKYKPAVTAWTPYLLGQFLVAAENGCDLSAFRHIGIGGSSIEKSLLNKFKLKCPAYVHLVYGMTELVVPVFHFDDDTPDGSTGLPLDKFQFKLVDADGSIIDESNKIGELWMKGENFFKGYLNNPQETEAILTDDGWIKTGDMFYRDGQGYYYFVERKRLLIKHYGFLIPPLQMEDVIKQHPGVLDACVVGIPDPECMERPIAAILKRDEDDVDPQEIFDLLKKTLSEYKQLSGGLFFVDSFPITPSGKINRTKVKELALNASTIKSK